MGNDEKKLDDLHTELCTILADGLKNGVEVVTKDGDVIITKPSPAFLNVARQFLKDNRIEGVAAKGTPISEVMATLPEFSEDSHQPFH